MVKSIDVYRDGGTIAIYTVLGEFTIDRRIGNKNRDSCVVFYGYPKENGCIENQEFVKKGLLDMIKMFEPPRPYQLKLKERIIEKLEGAE